jgi:hypothetical protein
MLAALFSMPALRSKALYRKERKGRQEILWKWWVTVALFSLRTLRPLR